VVKLLKMLIYALI